MIIVISNLLDFSAETCINTRSLIDILNLMIYIRVVFKKTIGKPVVKKRIGHCLIENMRLPLSTES